MERNHIVFFDGVCNLCNGYVQFLIKRDPEGKFSFAPLQDEKAEAILSKVEINPEALKSIVYFRDNKAYDQSDAVLEICRDMKGLWKLMLIFKPLPKFIRDGVYQFIARNRYRWFGKKDTCMVPTPDLKSRFL